jgi:nitrite reductase (cytochrome c-552)
MKKNILIVILLGLLVVLGGSMIWITQTPEEPVMTKVKEIPQGEVDPRVWGKVYPAQFDSYLKNSQGGKGDSKYKGSDKFSRLDSWPFQYVLSDGWGMGVEYQESRGHTLALVDQLEVDNARKGAGGVCLTCKSPAVPKLKKKMGEDFFKKPYKEVYNQIPVNEGVQKSSERLPNGRKLGIACIDCHNSDDMSLKLSRWTVREGIKELGKDPARLTRQEKKTLVCAQCHVTYSIPKNKVGKSIGVDFPWDNSKWGNVTIEDIEKTIESKKLYEWKSDITGMKLGHIRHPEFELFTNGSTHKAAGLSCADCHMPYKTVGKQKISSHQWTSPLKQDLKACTQCHTNDKEKLKDRIFYIQDRVNHNLTKAGFAAAQAAKAIEVANETAGIDAELLNEAKKYYRKAYYRVTFIAAENSMGFHNPEEALRVLTDGLDYARRSEIKTRQALVKAGINPPDKFDLELEKYDYNKKINKAATLDFSYQKYSSDYDKIDN